MKIDTEVLDELAKTLKLIAEGYLHKVEKDRWIIIENPNFTPVNGQNPYIVIDSFNPFTNPFELDEGYD